MWVGISFIEWGVGRWVFTTKPKNHDAATVLNFLRHWVLLEYYMSTVRWVGGGANIYQRITLLQQSWPTSSSAADQKSNKYLLRPSTCLKQNHLNNKFPNVHRRHHPHLTMNSFTPCSEWLSHLWLRNSNFSPFVIKLSSSWSSSLSVSSPTFHQTVIIMPQPILAYSMVSQWWVSVILLATILVCRTKHASKYLFVNLLLYFTNQTCVKELSKKYGKKMHNGDCFENLTLNFVTNFQFCQSC